MKNIIMAAGVALLLVGCGESEPSGRYQCEVEERDLTFLIDSKNKTWVGLINYDETSWLELSKKNPEENTTFTLTHNKDTEVYALNLSKVVNQKAESEDVATFKYDSDNNALNVLSLNSLKVSSLVDASKITFPFTCKNKKTEAGKKMLPFTK